MQKEPPPFVWAAPDEKDILTCALTSLTRYSLEILLLLFYRELYHRKTHSSRLLIPADTSPFPSLPF
jgi:hypothetical protein